MLTKSVTAAALLLSSVASVALSTTPAMAQAGGPPVPYSQCVKNVLGPSFIIARVKWYDPKDVKFTPADPRGDNADTKDVDESVGQLTFGFAKPVQENVISAGFDSCVTGIRGITSPKIATISVVGGKFATEAVKLGINTLAAGVSLISCPVTAGAGCAAAVAIAGAGANATASMASLAIPDAKETFYVGFPGTLELAGSAFNPSATDRTLGVAAFPYKVNVDYCISGLTDTPSASNITVDFLSNGKLVNRQKLQNAASGCAAEVETTATDIITAVRINTDGGDAMLIDQVQVYRDGRKIFWDGRENGGGYCLSTDAGDTAGGWEAVASGCSKSFTFSNPA